MGGLQRNGQWATAGEWCAPACATAVALEWSSAAYSCISRPGQEVQAAPGAADGASSSLGAVALPATP